MARKLAHKETDRGNGTTDGLPEARAEKSLLNRRKYLALGASAVAVGLGTGVDLAGAASDGEVTTFTTDFSEHAL